jgi:hypothetical protein
VAAAQSLQLNAVTERLFELQFEVNRLNHKVRAWDVESSQWSVRYTKRMVLLSNVLLGGWVFALRFVQSLRRRGAAGSSRHSTSWLSALFLSSARSSSSNSSSNALSSSTSHLARIASDLTRATPATLAAAAAAASSRSRAPLSVLLLSAVFEGLQSSILFFIAAGLHLRAQAWKRNLAFGLSAGSSLLLLSQADSPRASSYLNLFINVLYTIARYYHLHGLWVFGNMRLL